MISLIDTTLVGESFATCAPANADDRILVLGVGNLLMGDEGVGVHALRWLEAEPPLAGVRLLDGGTGGANLLGEFEGRRAIILIDATRDGTAARAWCSRVEAGMVGVNVPIPVPMAFHSFGGWKQSLFGTLHMHGPDGIRFYTRMKIVTARWAGDGAGGNGFAMPTMR